MRGSVTGEASLFRCAAASYPGRQTGRGLDGVVLHDGRDLHDEARAHRLVILHADVRAVLGDDVCAVEWVKRRDLPKLLITEGTLGVIEKGFRERGKFR